jgi:putative ABC transport system permease protein
MLAQQQEFADIGLGVGTLVTALAAIIVGETLLPPTSMSRLLLACVVGGVVYSAIIGVALRLGIAATDVKLATAALVILAQGTAFFPSRPRHFVVQRRY